MHHLQKKPSGKPISTKKVGQLTNVHSQMCIGSDDCEDNKRTIKMRESEEAGDILLEDMKNIR